MSDKYNKAPGPKEVFSRFKQRITHEPTDTQVERWEYEGGASPDEVNSVHTHTLSFGEKIKFYAEKILKIFHKPNVGTT